MMKLVQTASLSSPILKPSPARPDGLRIVLDHQQVVLVGDFADRLHVRALTV